MILKINNPAQFKKQVSKIVHDMSLKVLGNFKGQAEGSLIGQTQKFRGKKIGSIADPNSIVYTIRNRDLVLTINPNPITLDVFRRNAEYNPGGMLSRGEAPEWFDYNNIGVDMVMVRSTGEQGSAFRSPLGSDERQFFSKTYNYLVSNSNKIINDVWT